MTWTFVAAATLAGGMGVNITNPTISKPAGVASGDIMLAALQEWSGIGSAAYTAPAGWSLICHEDDSAGAGTGNDSTTVWWKIAGASEPASYTWTSSQASEFSGGIGCWSGNAASSPVDTSAAVNTGTSTTITSPAITTTADGDLIVVIDTVGSVLASGGTLTLPLAAGLTSRFNVKSADVQNAIAMGDVTQTTHGAVASGSYNGTFTASKGGGISGVAIVALKAAGGAVVVNPYSWVPRLGPILAQ